MSINFLKNRVKLEHVNYIEDNQEAVFEEDFTTKKISETSYKKIARLIVLAGVFLTPLFFLPFTTSALELNKQILLVVVAGVGLVLWLLDVVMSGQLSWRPNSLDKGILALCGVTAVSAIFSVSKFTSVFGSSGNLNDSFILVSALSVLYFLIVNSFDSNSSALKKLLSISLVIAMVYGVLQLFGFYVFQYLSDSVFGFTKSRAFNTVGSINMLGMIAAVSMPMLYRQRISVFRRFDISKIGVFLALGILILINWWVLWVVAIAGMVAVVMFESLAPLNKKDGFRISKFLFPMVVIVLGIFLVVINFNLASLKSKFPLEIAPSHKLSVKVTWSALQERPVWGYGPETFSIVFDKYGAGDLRNTTLSEIKLSDSTSHFTNAVAHNGFLGLAGFVFLLWLIIHSLIKAGKERLYNLNSENIGVIASLVAVVVASFFYPFNTTLTFLFYGFLSLTTIYLWQDKIVTYDIEKRATLSLVSSLGFIGGLMLALVGLYFVSMNYVSDLKYFKALTSKDVKASFDYSLEAIKWNGNDDKLYRTSSQLAINLLSQEVNTKPARDDTQKNNRVQNYISSSVALAQKATQVVPDEPNNWVNLGDIYQNLIQLVDGADSLAEASYLKASELRPGDPGFYNRTGSMYLMKSELLRQLALAENISIQQLNQQAGAALSKAENSFKKAIALSNNFGLAIYNLGIVYERQGKVNEAIVQLEKLAPFNSDKPGLALELGLLYYRANQQDKAVGQFKRAILLFPDYANARWYLALIYEERKNINEATEQLEKILSIDVNKNNQTVIKKLSELRSGKASIPPKKVLDQKPL